MSYSLTIPISYTDDPANNQTTVSSSLTLHSTLANQFQQYWLDFTLTLTGSHKIVDHVGNTTDYYYMDAAHGTSYDLGLGSGSYTYPRSLTGALTNVQASGSVDAPNSATYLPQNVTGSSGVLSFTDFSGPGTPSAPTLTRTSPYTTIGLTSATASKGSMNTQRYAYRYSSDGETTWTTTTITPTGAYPNLTPVTTASFSTTSTVGYHVQTRGESNYSTTWGIGSWSASTFFSGIPAAPASITLTQSGRTVQVTCEASVSNGGPTSNPTGGAAITAYYVQASKNGGAYGTAQLMTSRSYTYTGLDVASNYTFRVYSVNSTGNSAYTVSSSVYIAAYGRRYQSKTITGVTAVGSTTTYTCANHGFSVGDPIDDISGITPSTLNITAGTITATTTNSFTVGSTTPATTSGTYSSGGTVTGWAMMLTGQRYDSNGGGAGIPGWVDMGTADKYTAGTWTPFGA